MFHMKHFRQTPATITALRHGHVALLQLAAGGIDIVAARIAIVASTPCICRRFCSVSIFFIMGEGFIRLPGVSF